MAARLVTETVRVSVLGLGLVTLRFQWVGSLGFRNWVEKGYWIGG